MLPSNNPVSKPSQSNVNTIPIAKWFRRVNRISGEQEIIPPRLALSHVQFTRCRGRGRDAVGVFVVSLALVANQKLQLVLFRFPEFPATPLAGCRVRGRRRPLVRFLFPLLHGAISLWSPEVAQAFEDRV